jgi:hypothetical protein
MGEFFAANRILRPNFVMELNSNGFSPENGLCRRNLPPTALTGSSYRAKSTAKKRGSAIGWITKQWIKKHADAIKLSRKHRCGLAFRLVFA